MKTPVIKLCLLLMAGFVLFTVIGTLSHELGHYSVARLMVTGSWFFPYL